MSRFSWPVKVILASLAVAIVPAVLVAAIGPFQGPLFHMATAPNGELLVADASSGIVGIRSGVIGSTSALPGVTGVSPIGRGSMWATTGGAPDATADNGQGLHRVSHGTSRKIVNLFAFENANDPDQMGVDSNPFDVLSLGGHAALVADAGANDLLRVNNQGDIAVLAIFQNEIVSTDNIKALAGCPSPAPFCGLPALLPAQAVPTSVEIGPDGNIFVAELKGFPAPTNESNIWRVSPGANRAQCGTSPDCVKVFDGGFTSIIDLAFGPDGRLYVLEFDERSWAAVEIFGMPTGGTINACDLTSASCVVVASGIPVPTAISFGKDGTLWATRNALTLGGAEVFAVR
jgi:hypothetical protein